MRAEKMEKVTPVAMIIGKLIHVFEDINSENDLRIELELKQQCRRAEERIREFQKETHKNQDGYYVSAGIVYKVYHMNTVVKKITGDEAKNVKREIKKYIQANSTNQSKEMVC